MLLYVRSWNVVSHGACHTGHDKTTSNIGHIYICMHMPHYWENNVATPCHATPCHVTSRHDAVTCTFYARRIFEKCQYIHSILPSWAGLGACPEAAGTVSHVSRSRSRQRFVVPCDLEAPALASVVVAQYSIPS